jgi:hypothetical protein
VVWLHLWKDALEVRKSALSTGPASPLTETDGDGGKGKYGIEEVRTSDFLGVVSNLCLRDGACRSCCVKLESVDRGGNG